MRNQIASRSGSGTGVGASGTSPETFSTQQSTMPSPSTTSPSPFFVSRCTSGGQPSLRSMLKVKEKKEADRLVGRCLLWSGIPFNFAKNPFYVSMFEAAAIVVPGYKPPTYEELRGPILQDEKVDCTHRLEDLRKSWELTGCTVVSDGWTDMKGRTLLNFLVHCPKGIMFMKSVDASAHVKDAALLCSLLDEFIQEIGPQHVVQVITDNTVNYVSAGRMLMARYPSLFWTPCAAHCLDLMLEDLSKIDWIMETINSARSITTFIYNHAAVLSLMRTFTGDKELVRPAITRFATSFISLQSLLGSMWDLQQMFLSPEWHALSFSTRPEGQAIFRLVTYHQSFWDAVREVCAVTEPLVKVLCLVDGDKPAMGYLYEAMDRAKESIHSYYEDKGDQGQEKQQIIWGLIDARWNHTLYRPIHAAGLYLNLAFAYSYGFRFDAKVMYGFYECVHKMVPSSADRAELSQELEVYKRATELLGFDMAVNDRTNLMPNTWWENYGGCVPILQRLATRVLSQTCSSSGCKCNWSVFEKVHSKKRNRLDTLHLNDLVYTHYNLRLWMKQYEKRVDAKAISLDEIDTTAAWRAEDDHDSDHDDLTKAPYEDDPVPEKFHTESGSVPQLETEPRSRLEGDRPGSSTVIGRVAVGLPPRASSSSSRYQFQPPSVSRGHHFAGSFSRGRQIPVRGPQASKAPSPRGRARAVSTMITFSRKRGRGNR